ncbi:type II secretion system protein [Citricoccus zhacaiensis]
MNESITSIARALRDRAPRNENAFTLLELLTVILIIGIVSAIAFPSLTAVKRDNQDQQTVGTLTSAVEVMESHASRGQLGAEFTLADFHPEAMRLSAEKGVVLRSLQTETGYCLSAYHEGGNNNADTPILFDSTLGVKGEFSYEPTANCDSLQLDAPAYFVNDKKKLEKVSAPASPASSDACHTNIQPGRLANNALYADATVTGSGTSTVQRITLLGTVDLSKDCQSVDYSLRVQNADPDATYTLAVQPTGSVEHVTEEDVIEYTTSRGPETVLTFDGTSTLTNSLPTGMVQEMPVTKLSLEGLRNSAVVMESNNSPTWGHADAYPVVPENPRTLAPTA